MQRFMHFSFPHGVLTCLKVNRAKVYALEHELPARGSGVEFRHLATTSILSVSLKGVINCLESNCLRLMHFTIDFPKRVLNGWNVNCVRINRQWEVIALE